MTKNIKKNQPHYQKIKLPYELNELEPTVDFNTMRYHYDILHSNYEKSLAELRLGKAIEEKYPTLQELMENLNEEEFKKMLPLGA